MADKVVPIRDLFASTLKPAPSKTVVPPPDDEKITSLDDPRLKSPFGEKKPAVSPNDEIIKLTEHKPLFGEQYQPKIKTPEDAPTEDDALASSLRLHQRLKPYFDNIMTQLAISFDSYILPNDLYFRIAEVYDIKNRGDLFITDLLLTIGKLQPLITKKAGVRWSTIEKNIVTPLIRKHRAEHYESNFRLDTIPLGQWFYGDVPISSGMDILLAAQRMKCQIMYDEWSDVCRITYNNEVLNSMKLDEIYYLLSEELTYHFKFRIEKKHVMDALGILRRTRENVFNSRIEWTDGFLQFYDPIRDKDWDWITEITEALHSTPERLRAPCSSVLWSAPTALAATSSI